MESCVDRHRICVLLVDDQMMIGEAVRRMLVGETDVDFHFCQNPVEAIEAARNVNPTVILQDLIMPEVDGLTLVKYFRAETSTREVPLIVLSSEEDAVTKAKAFEFGANDYLIKLPDRVELMARIRYHSRAYINMLERNDAFEAMMVTQRMLSAELAEAADYVLSLLPPPMDGDLKVDWEFIPSTSLGGDSFGYHWLDDDNFAIYLLDVAGHGVGAALLSVSAIEALRTHTLPSADFYDPASVLTQLNHVFKMQEHNQKFFSIWYGVYNRRDRELCYATGGHPPAVLIHGESPENAVVEQLRTRGTIIGAIDEATYENATIHLGDNFARLFVFSDGTFEIVRPDDSMWRFDEFLELLSTISDGDSLGLDAIREHIASVKGDENFEDDFSMMRIAF